MTYQDAQVDSVLMGLAATGTMAIAVAAPTVARGDPPVSDAGGVGGLSDGVDPPGGIMDEPPEVANTDGAWTATVGGTEFAGLTEDDVGTVLWRGSRVPVEIAGEASSIARSSSATTTPMSGESPA